LASSPRSSLCETPWRLIEQTGVSCYVNRAGEENFLPERETTLAGNHYSRKGSSNLESGVESMAERKSALNRAPQRPELERLLDRAKTVQITEAMLREQRASFVYGNAPKGSRITKASAISAIDHVRVTGTEAD
jgi:hypothetical protein